MTVKLGPFLRGVLYILTGAAIPFIAWASYPRPRGVDWAGAVLLHIAAALFAAVGGSMVERSIQ